MKINYNRAILYGLLPAMKLMDGLDKKYDPLYGFNIKAEYDLIMKKKSKLSRAMRESIINKYEEIK